MFAEPSRYMLTPAQAVAACCEYAEALPAERRNQVRFVQLTAIDEKGLAAQQVALNYILNAVSRSRIITRCELFGGCIAVVDLNAYADATDGGKSFNELFAAWEKLAAHDFHFHIRTEIIDANEKTGKREVTVDGGWVGLDNAKKLRELTGSFGAVLRVDYFIATVGQSPTYYEWSGLGATEAEIFKQLGIDEKGANNAIASVAANLLRSHVTNKPRRLVGYDGIIGYAFVSLDTDRETADADPFRLPVDANGQKFNRVASEGFAQKANGFWATWIVDGDGKRQDAVLDKIAKDFTGDGIIRAGVGCVRCHELHGGAGGLQPFTDHQSLLQRKAGVAAYDPAVAQVLAAVYDPGRFGKWMARAREDYHDAVMSACGVEPKEAMQAVADLYSFYLDSQVTPERAAYELSVAPDYLADALAGTGDPILLLLMLGEPVNRGPWDSSYAEAALKVETWRQSK